MNFKAVLSARHCYISFRFPIEKRKQIYRSWETALAGPKADILESLCCIITAFMCNYCHHYHMGTGDFLEQAIPEWVASFEPRTPSVFQQLRAALAHSRYFHMLKEPICAYTEHTVKKSRKWRIFFFCCLPIISCLGIWKWVWFEGCTLISDHNLTAWS